MQNKLGLINISEENATQYLTKPNGFETMQPDNKDNLYYGDVNLNEFQALVRILDEENIKNQNNNRELDTPLGQLPNFKLKSYKQLVYSKRGFHQPYATSFIASILPTRDVYRNTFLGEISTFKPRQGENLDDLIRIQSKKWITDYVNQGHEQLEKGNVQMAQDQAYKALNLNPSDGDALSLLACVKTVNQNYKDAVCLFETALSDPTANKFLIKRCLSECFFEKGKVMFFKNDHEEAKKLFLESLKADSNNAGASLHLAMSEKRLNEQRR